jgi:superfamily II DNA/RNA helicase
LFSVISGLCEELGELVRTNRKPNSGGNVEVLLETMEDFVKPGTNTGEPTRFIIFVKTIEVAKRLSQLLNNDKKAYKCESFTGTRGIILEHLVLI